MLKLAIGQKIHLTKDGASITDTVKSYHVALDLDGNEAIVSVTLDETNNSFTLAKTSTWSNEPWTVEATESLADILETMESIIDRFPTL
jgi:hypothetical protein